MPLFITDSGAASAAILEPIRSYHREEALLTNSAAACGPGAMKYVSGSRKTIRSSFREGSQALTSAGKLSLIHIYFDALGVDEYHAQLLGGAL